MSEFVKQGLVDMVCSHYLCMRITVLKKQAGHVRLHKRFE